MDCLGIFDWLIGAPDSELRFLPCLWCIKAFQEHVLTVVTLILNLAMLLTARVFILWSQTRGTLAFSQDLQQGTLPT